MKTEQLNEFVKKIEPFFLGYTAEENRLKNSNGMELIFRVDWKNKTTVSGLNAKHRHSIGCSFDKPLEKVFKDIRRRLIPAYHADFFENKREKMEQAEAEHSNSQKLKALASVIGGQVERHYGHRGSANSEYVYSESASIYQTYQGNYEFNIVLEYIDAMRLAKILKELDFPKKPLTTDD